MSVWNKTFLAYGVLIAALSTGCKKASFDTKEGLNNYTFDSMISADNSMSFELQVEYETVGDTISPASLNNGQILLHEINSASSETEDEGPELKFQHTVNSYKVNPDNSISLYKAPYLSKRPALNTATTALYLKIKNSLPYTEFEALSISHETWGTLLRTYENLCTNCLNLTLKENLEMLNQDSILWGRITKTIGENLSWSHKNFNTWSWTRLNSTPQIFAIKKVTFTEGTDLLFTANLFHPSNPAQAFQPTAWSHNFDDINNSSTTAGAEANVTVSYDQDINAEYSMSFDVQHPDLPTFTYTTAANFDNTNRAAQAASALPTINLAAGQEIKINLTQYFEDLDNPNEVLTLFLVEENSVFKRVGTTDLLIYGPATPFFIGSHTVEFRIQDSEFEISELFSININISPNTPPDIAYAFKGTDESTKYYNNDIIEFTEAELNQALTIVSTDVDDDRTQVEILNPDVLKRNFTYDPSKTFGIYEPRIHSSSKWSFDYDKSGYFFFTPGTTNESRTKFLIRPSFYQLDNQANGIYTLEFKVNKSDAHTFLNPGYSYSEVPIDDIDKDTFNIRIRVINKDDPPVSITNLTTAPVTENIPFSIDINALVTLEDKPLNASAVSMPFTSTTCDWINHSGGVLSGTPPYDATESCLVTFKVFDSASTLHGSTEAPNDLRAPDFNVTIPVTNVNRPPLVQNGLSLNLGDRNEDETEFFTLPLLDSTPGDGNLDGHFTDLDYDFTDPANPLVDPLEEFTFTCELAEQGTGAYSDCASQGVEFLPNGYLEALITIQHGVLFDEVSKDFDMRINFKDRVTAVPVSKVFQMRVINKPAPVSINLKDTFKRIDEGNFFTTELQISRFSADETTYANIDTYPFEIYLNCIGCPPDQNIITSATTLDYSNAALYENQNVFITDVSFLTNYDHGDDLSGGSFISYLMTAESRSLNESYSSSTPISPQVTATDQLTIEVVHKNLPPSAISINGNSNENTTFVYTVNRNNVNGIEELLTSVLDPDVQDITFDTVANNLTGNVISFANDRISINYSLCPIEGRTLTKNFSISGMDSSGATKTRNVQINILNVDTFAATCN